MSDLYDLIREAIEENFMPVHQGREPTHYIEEQRFLDALSEIIEKSPKKIKKYLDHDIIDYDGRIYGLRGIGRYTYLNEEIIRDDVYEYYSDEMDSEDDF